MPSILTRSLSLGTAKMNRGADETAEAVPYPSNGFLPFPTMTAAELALCVFYERSSTSARKSELVLLYQAAGVTEPMSGAVLYARRCERTASDTYVSPDVICQVDFSSLSYCSSTSALPLPCA